MSVDFSRRIQREMHIQGDGRKLVSFFVGQHHLKSLFAESTLLFAVNGLIITLELENPIAGTVLMIAGMLISISGLIYMFVHEEVTSFPKPPRFFNLPIILVISLAVAELAFVSTYEAIILDISALLSFITGAAAALIAYLYYKHEFRFVYVEMKPQTPP